MADLIGPFDTAPWAQAEWYQFAPLWAASGVVGMPAASVSTGSFGVTANGLTATVASDLARAWIDGGGYQGDGNKAITVPANTNASLSRRDRIVLRRDLAAKTCTPVLIEGTPATSPAAPAVTQNTGAGYDLRICSFLVPPNSGTTLSGFVDERRWLDPAGGGTLATATINGPGWAASATNPPRVYLTGHGTARYVGAHTNTGAFTPNATQFPVIAPAGFRPTTEQVFAVPFVTPGAGAGFVLSTLLTDGRLRYDTQMTGPSIAANSAFFLDSIEWHLSA